MTDRMVDWDRLGRYLAGEASPDEAAAMRRWLEAHPADARVLATLDAAAKAAAAEQTVDVEGALRRVRARARSRSAWRYVTVAAAAAVLLAAVVVTRRGSDEPGSLAGATVVHSTAVGERDSIALADGSRVILGPATMISVRGREVQLTGEALFDVLHDPRRPFVVRAGNAVIRDIGTTFTVHSDSAGPARVVVTEGIVELKHAADSVTLRAGDVGVVDSAGAVKAARGAATADDLAWTRGRLVFRNAPMPEVAADLRRWYGVELRVLDSDTALLRRHFSGTFVGDDSADRVLAVIALAFGARVERRGDTAYLRAAPSSR